jgi:transposase InsO family protein
MKHRDEYPVALMCKVFGVSRSGFYDWLNREESERSLERRKLLLEVERVFTESDSTYGSPRITRKLNKEGMNCSRNRVARLMRGKGQRLVHRDKLRVITTDSNHSEPVAPRIL